MHRNLDARKRRPVRLGVAGAVLAFLALAGVQALAVRPYLPPDELYHVGYATTILGGRLPTLTTPLPASRLPLSPDDGRLRRVYVANHPPLFYAIAAVPLWLGERLGAPRAALLAARLLSAWLAAAGVVMVAWLAALLVPARPRVTDDAGGRGDRHDQARALGAHDRQHGAGDVEWAEQGGLDLGPEVLGADLLEEPGIEVAGVVDQHVDAAEPHRQRDRRDRHGQQHDGAPARRLTTTKGHLDRQPAGEPQRVGDRSIGAYKHGRRAATQRQRWSRG